METTSPHFALEVVAAQPPTAGKRQRSVADKDRKKAWEFHYGPHAKEALCQLCGVNNLVKNDIGSWQAGHIVARDYLDIKLRSNPLYLVPCCTGCNLETSTDCVLNLLWERRRADVIKTICKRVYDSFKEMNLQRMSYYDDMIWKVIRGLYGFESHKLGGGIRLAYEEPIYQMLKLHQIELLESEMSQAMTKLKKNVILSEKLFDEVHFPCNGTKRQSTGWI
jgi:hypothetical protein